MRRLITFTLVTVASGAGCFFEKQIPKTVDPLMGGSIMLDAPCGYMVKTVNDASMPVKALQHKLGPDPTPKFVHLTVPNNPSTGVAVLWRTNDEMTLSTTVQYGVGTATDQSIDGLTFYYNNDNGNQIRMHETHLCGLQPDTQYSYRVGGKDAETGVESWSPVYSFRTAPDRTKSPDAQVLLLVIGDTRDHASVWGQALQTAMQKGPPEFVLFSGDSTFLGQDQDEWDAWWMAADPLLASVPMIVAHGNHDVNSVNFYSQMALPGDEANYDVDIGPVHLSVANDTPLDSAAVMGQNATLLSQHVMEGVRAPWNLVMHHKPVFSASAGPHPNDQLPQRMYWQPIYDQFSVDMVFNGHDHDYERTKPMRGMTAGTNPSDGTIYVVVGSAGAELYDKGTQFWTDYSEKTYAFSMLSVRKGMLKLDAYRPDGSSIESFTATKP
jgi:hypothetical protein